MFGKGGNPVVKSFIAFLLLAEVIFVSSALAQPGKQYPLTIEALKERYVDEIMAHRKYSAYSKRACAEGYPNIAHLFKALAASESVHARNFATLLSELGINPKALPVSGKVDVASTRYNLKHAATVERDEIDRKYPKILEKIKPENHKKAIQYIRYAWEAEKQHRELIVKIQKAAVRWFGILANRIEGKDSHYYVCQICGSTLMEKSGDHCPICKKPMSEYRKISPYPAGACPVPDDEEEEGD